VDAYLDHAATTPLRPEALAAMLPWLGERFGNPSGAHRVAREARRAVDEAREAIAAVLGARPGEVVFTANGTEAANLAVLGVARRRPGAVVCSAVEHHAVLRSCAAVGGTTVAVGGDGVLDLDELVLQLHPGVSLVAVMAANNETGAFQPLEEVEALVRTRAPDAAVFSDAVAAVPAADPARLMAGVDLLSLSAHKFGGPKGAGVLVVRSGTALAPLLHGGSQERDRRPGTHDVAGIVGMAAALVAAAARRVEECERVGALRDRLADGLLAAVPDTTEHGPSRRPGRAGDPDAGSRRLPGIVNLGFAGVDDEELLVLLDDEGVQASAGAACASGAAEPSHVLRAMGLSPAQARSAVRFSLGHATTEAEVGHALAVVPKAVERLRA